MKEYRVGKIIDSFVNHQEGALFDISDGGANLIIFFRHPTKVKQTSDNIKHPSRKSRIGRYVIFG